MMQQLHMTIKNDVTAQKEHLTSSRTWRELLTCSDIWQSDWAQPNTEPPELSGVCRETSTASTGCVVVAEGTKGQNSFRVSSKSTVTIKHHRAPAKCWKIFTGNTQDSLAGKQPLLQGPFSAGGDHEVPARTFPWCWEHTKQRGAWPQEGHSKGWKGFDLCCPPWKNQ